MPPKMPLNTQSNSIKIAIEAKRKSKHRLIGSIFLLIAALILLLNITNKLDTKKLQQKQNIQIIITKDTSLALNVPHESSNKNSITNNILINKPIQQESQHLQNTDKILLNNKKKIPPIIKNEQQQNHKINTANKITITLSPNIITNNKSKLTPDDILNQSTRLFYVQLIVSSDKNKILKIQKILNSQGLFSKIEIIEKKGYPLYKLQMGPYTSNQIALKYYLQVQNKHIEIQ